LLYRLYKTIPGLYEHELEISKSAMCWLFQPARTNSIDAKLFHSVVDAHLDQQKFKIELGACIVGMHPFRQGEWFTFHRQLCVSGDDMNIIQVAGPPGCFSLLPVATIFRER
jgi:hypothetical protein